MSVALTKQIFKLEEEVSRLREKLVSEERARIMRIKDLKERNASYKKAYSILMEHWECFPADIKIDIDEQLKKENL